MISNFVKVGRAERTARQFDEGNTTNQYPYAKTVPRPAAVVMSSQRRFLSFPVMGAMGIFVVVGEKVAVRSRLRLFIDRFGEEIPVYLKNHWQT